MFACYRYDAVATMGTNTRVVFTMKIFLYVTAILLAAAELALSSVENLKLEPSEYLYVASIILSVSSCAIIIRLRGGARAFPSAIIFITWLLTAALHLPLFLVILENYDDISSADACQLLLMPVFVLLSLLECFGGASSSNEEGCSLMSRLTIGWMTPLIRTGFRRELSEDDMPRIRESVRLAQTKTRFGQHYTIGQDGAAKRDSFLTCLLKTFGTDLVVVGLFRLSTDIIYFAGPQLLRQLIRVLETDDLAWKGTF